MRLARVSKALALPRALSTPARAFSTTTFQDSDKRPPWLDRAVPAHYWSDHSNRRAYFLWIGARLSFRRFGDFYRISASALRENHGGGLLELFGGSHSEALRDAFPEVSWKAWNFDTISRKFWDSPSALASFIDSLTLTSDPSNPKSFRFSDILKLLASPAFVDLAGRSLDKSHSIIEVFTTAYPQAKVDPFDSPLNSERGFWTLNENRIGYFNQIGIKLGVKRYPEFLKITSKRFEELNELNTLKGHFNGSIAASLESVYPACGWKFFAFSSMPHASTWSHSQILLLLRHLEQKFDVSSSNEWNRIAKSDLVDLGLAHIVEALGGLEHLLQKFQLREKAKRILSRGKQAAQLQMVLKLRQLFPGHQVIEEHHHPDLRYATGRAMELDAFIPSLGIAFEYHGQMHYHSNSHFGDSSKRARADEEKRSACARHGILLVEVPYWWDGSKEQLLNTIELAKGSPTDSEVLA